MYYTRIDGLRALAVGAVMASHYLPEEYLLGVPWGSFGVHLFFVISGFLITGILNRSSINGTTTTLKAFLFRRLLRIFPLYYFCLTFITAMGWANMGSDAWWHWTYLSNWFFLSEGYWVEGHPAHFWSLAVEEQFYLFWPLLFLVMRKKSAFGAGVLLIAISMVYRLDLFGSGVLEDRLWNISTPACLGSLGLGACLSVVIHKFKTRLIGQIWLTSFLLLLSIHASAYFCRVPSELRHQSFVVFSTLLVWFVCRAKRTWLDRFFDNRIVRYLGSISYGLYIWHNFMGTPWYGIAEYFSFPDSLTYGIPGIVGKTILTVLFASATWYGFEKPLLRYKIRFQYA
ncbi:acyltransferase [Flavobacteriales bacterium]|nr:acyltransferase [Flavobacteriales bacterium]